MITMIMMIMMIMTTTATATATSISTLSTASATLNYDDDDDDYHRELAESIGAGVGIGFAVILLALGVFAIYAHRRMKQEQVLLRRLATDATSHAGTSLGRVRGSEGTLMSRSAVTLVNLPTLFNADESTAAAVAVNSVAGNHAETAPDADEQTLYQPNQITGMAIPGHLQVDSNRAFRELQTLARNKYTRVFLAEARDKELRQRSTTGLIVVKEISGITAATSMSNNSNVNVDAFHREVGILFLFSCKPGFIKILGFSESPCYSIITEYYPAGTLDQALFKSRIITSTLRLIISFALDISRAVQTMHGYGFSHSDLKSSNIFMEQANNGIPSIGLRCLLGDFGLARALRMENILVKHYQVSNVKGLTVPYAAPEVLRRFHSLVALPERPEEYYTKADIYSVAMILQELVNSARAWTTGHNPVPVSSISLATVPSETKNYHDKAFCQSQFSDGGGGDGDLINNSCRIGDLDSANSFAHSD